MDLIHARETNGIIEEIAKIKRFINYNNVLDEESTLENNDFELELKPSHWKDYDIRKNDWLYFPKTEWGGKVTRITNSGSSVLVGGPNFRALLTNRIIPPPFNVTFGKYLIIDLELNEALKFLYEYQPNTPNIDVPYFVFSQDDTGIQMKEQFRFEQYLKAVTKRLKTRSYRLEVRHEYLHSNKLLRVTAEPITDYSEFEFYNEDSKAYITSTSDETYLKKYLLCLGQGELEDRMVVLLEKEGSIVTVVNDLTDPKYADFLTDTEIYDYSSAETREELIKGGTERLLDKCGITEEVNIHLNENIDYYLGDIIGGEDSITGIKVRQSIIKKELNFGSDGKKISYTLGGL